ncbi:hypothetical protein DM15PD_00280 [Aristophania vespae]|nr:hypothetical protein DM15PD_00280 [Aristophania vespae]
MGKGVVAISDNIAQWLDGLAKYATENPSPESHQRATK